MPIWGTFGKRPIRLAWFTKCRVCLALLLGDYFGPGRRAPDVAGLAAEEFTFTVLAPSWALYPVIALATLATVIASQALISWLVLG